MSVTTLLSLDRPGLFHRAIMQSGAGHCAQTKEDASLVTKELAELLDIEQPTAEAFAEIALNRILTAQDAISNAVTTTPDKDKWGESTVMSGMAFFPVIDGDLLTQRPIDAIAAGAGANVPVLTGTNTEEYRLFLAPTPAVLGMADDFKKMLTAYGIESAVPGVYDFYKSKLPANTRPFGIFAAIASDFFFRIPACRVAERARPHPRPPTCTSSPGAPPAKYQPRSPPDSAPATRWSSASRSTHSAQPARSPVQPHPKAWPRRCIRHGWSSSSPATPAPPSGFPTTRPPDQSRRSPTPREHRDRQQPPAPPSVRSGRTS